MVRAQKAISLRPSSARSLKATHTVYHEQSSFVSIATSSHRPVTNPAGYVGVPRTLSGLRCDRLLGFSSGAYEQRRPLAARGINLLVLQSHESVAAVGFHRTQGNLLLRVMVARPGWASSGKRGRPAHNRRGRPPNHALLLWLRLSTDYVVKPRK